MPTTTKSQLAIDPKALRRAFDAPIRANSEWCVACGASGAASPELPSIVEQQIAMDPEILKQIVKADFVKGLSESLSGADKNSDWCVACGASSALAPELVSNPADLTDNAIEALSGRLLEGRG